MGDEGNHNAMEPPPAIQHEGRGVLAAEVVAAPVRWLWHGRIPVGAITLLDGDPGLGESLVTLDLAARVSRGWAMPDGTPGEAGGVVLLSAEDVVSATIRLRLDAAGADLEQVYILQTVAQTVAVRVAGSDQTHESGVWLPLDEPIVEAAIARVSAKLVVIDPLMAFEQQPPPCLPSRT